MDSFYVELPPVDSDDPLFRHKTEILDQRSLAFRFSVSGADSCVQCESHVDAMLKTARILNLNEIEWYFLEEDEFGTITFRNELEALNTVFAALKCVKKAKEEVVALNLLIEIVIQKFRLLEAADNVEAGISCDGDKESKLLDWARREGIESKLDVAVFDGFGRGLRAAVDIAVNDIVMKIPQHLIISEDFVDNTDLGLALNDFEGVIGDTKVLLWSMRERHKPYSMFAPYFASLPDSFNTGLSFGISALQVLDGTMVLEELMQAKEHLRLEYEKLFPELSNKYPSLFPENQFTWEMYLWACELWYSNGLKICFPDGSIKTCLVPYMGLLNHSLHPHVTHYSKIDPESKSLIVHAARPLNAGKQCFLNYGALSNSHLLMFYGFVLGRDNPFDVVPIDLDLSDSPDRLALIEKANLGLSHMVRGTWLIPFRIPSRLLTTLCIALMDEDEARSLTFSPKHNRDRGNKRNMEEEVGLVPSPYTWDGQSTTSFMEICITVIGYGACDCLE
ncbi:hypothetical protein KP509_18G038400 [Ceratopteris richardii]|uniref:SET domain-containing protein n=1 Tax=Ceratopteris richardii TaxID=49495 RepID=A0A8T2SQZ7_CERRI|nr:hypothetical protein KP509_18G038400 [Ceratopteris richardii]